MAAPNRNARFTLLIVVLLSAQLVGLALLPRQRVQGQGGNNPVAVFSAASAVAPDSIAVIYGVGLATGVGVPTGLPLPTELAGTTVLVGADS